MKIELCAKSAITKSLSAVVLGVLAGAGAVGTLWPLPSLAQTDDARPSLNLRPNVRPGNDRRIRDVEAGDYEIKGEELRRCSLEAGTGKKNCTPVVMGYGQIISYGTQLYAQGNLVGAETIFRQLVESRPQEATPHYKLGIILDRQGRTEEAITSYRQAIVINSKHALARNSLGVALARQGQLDEAINEWRQAVQINSEYADALTNWGLALLQQGQEAAAVENFKRARELFVKQREFQKAKQIEDLLQQINSRST